MTGCNKCGGLCDSPHSEDAFDVFAPCPLCRSKEGVGWDANSGVTCSVCGINLPPRSNDEMTLEVWNKRGL